MSKLLNDVRNALRVSHYALKTEKPYVSWIKRFILFQNKTHPLEMGKKEIEEFLTWLTVKRHVSPSTQNQALQAILFLYRRVNLTCRGWMMLFGLSARRGFLWFFLRLKLLGF